MTRRIGGEPAVAILMLVSFVLAPERCQAAPDAMAILRAGVDAETKITTGRVQRTTTVVYRHYSEAELRATIKNRRDLATAIEIERTRPRLERVSGTLTFDHVRHSLLITATDNRVAYRIARSARAVKDYAIPTKPGENDKPSMMVTTPLNEQSLEDLPWLSRNWTSIQAAIDHGDDTLSVLKPAGADNTAILYVRPKNPKWFRHKLWVRLDQGNTIEKRETYDEHDNQVGLITTDYEPQGGGLWYPRRVLDVNYGSSKTGQRYAYRTCTVTGSNVALNIPLSEADTAFGSIPLHTQVQDNRFGKPVVYEQQGIQYTDEQLSAMAHGQMEVPVVVLNAHGPRRKRQQASWVRPAGAGVLAVGIFAILLRARQRARAA